jgi:hypothetical protein
MPDSGESMVIVVGTSHTIQIADTALGSFLEGLCREFNAQAVAEEMNEEALAEKGCAASVPMQVAGALQMPHRFCDPNREERSKLAILQENEIRVRAWLANTPLSDSEVAARVKESYAKRERFWLKKLRDLNLWPVLFICGADHVTSFCHLLKQEGFVAHLAAEDWASNNRLQSDA